MMVSSEYLPFQPFQMHLGTWAIEQKLACMIDGLTLCSPEVIDGTWYTTQYQKIATITGTMGTTIRLN